MVEVTMFEYVVILFSVSFISWFLTCIKHDVWNIFTDDEDEE